MPRVQEHPDGGRKYGAFQRVRPSIPNAPLPPQA